MSLKGFHVLFISAAVLLALGIGVGCLRTWFREDGTSNLAAGVASLSAAAALVGYETWFLRKSRRLP